MDTRALVRQGQAFSSEYKGILANHLPMGLFALDALGADEKRLSDFYHFYIQRLHSKKEALGSITRQDWLVHLGQHRFYSEYVNFFQAEYDRLGQSTLLIDYLPRLLEASGSCAFHGLIRTAYGVDFNEPTEIVEGMAYWALSYLPLQLQPSSDVVHHSNPLQILMDAYHDPALSVAPKGSNIVERMQTLFQYSRLSHYIDALPMGPKALDRIAAAMIKLYAVTDDFTVLHAVTGTHAFRILLPFLSNADRELRGLWASLIVAVLTERFPLETLDAVIRNGKSLLQEKAKSSWQNIREAAIASDDEHIFKIVYSCMREQECYGWPLYQAVAARKAGLEHR